MSPVDQRPCLQGTTIRQDVLPNLNPGESLTRAEIIRTQFKHPYLARWTPSPVDPAGESIWAVATNLLVTFRDDHSADAARGKITSRLAQLGAPPPLASALRVRPIPLPRTFLLFAKPSLIEVPDTGPPAYPLAFMASLRQHEDIEAANPDFLHFSFFYEDIPEVQIPDEEISMDLLRIGALDAWTKGPGSREVRIAVLDTGIEITHHALTGNIHRIDGKDVVFNAYDDLNPGNVADDNGHGTFCSGIIGASKKTGVNKEVAIIPIKFLSSSGCGTSTDAIEGIEFAIKKEAHIISASWGAVALAPELEQKIDEAGKHGILFVTGAGNEKRDLDVNPFFPAAYELPNVLSVGGVDDDDRPVPNWGQGKSKVDLSAPGVTVFSTKRGNRFGTGNGTSAATAYVAGAAGLVKAANMSWEFKDIKKQLIDKTSDPTGVLHGTGVSASEGRLDLARALGVTP